MAVTMQFRLCESDRKQYGVDGWTDWDEDRILDLTADEIIEYETAMGGYTLAQYSAELSTTFSARAQKARAWLGLRMAGHNLAWGEFSPKVLRVETRTPETAVDGAGNADEQASAT